MYGKYRTFHLTYTRYLLFFFFVSFCEKTFEKGYDRNDCRIHYKQVVDALKWGNLTLFPN